jgi:hypothetical protein
MVMTVIMNCGPISTYTIMLCQAARTPAGGTTAPSLFFPQVAQTAPESACHWSTSPAH